MSPRVADWFHARFEQPTPIQRRAWPRVYSGHSCLIAAGTGQGKSLAALLPLIDRLLQSPAGGRILYVAPLRALSNNMAEGLIEQIDSLCAGRPRALRVAVRTGDTPLAQRRAQLRRPPQLLLTTPESLFVLLGSAGGRRLLSGFSAVVVDEIHALADSKRGAHLALSLGRVDALIGKRELQRIGLSATARPLRRMARFLVGTDRPCAMVSNALAVPVDVRLEVGAEPLQSLAGQGRWAFVIERLAEFTRDGERVLVFCNTRALVERLAAALAERLGERRVAAHHGSLGLARRSAVEQGLRAGEL
ncbi:MAG: DEAD/DEAH box helicase, partial [Wenzhouxiangella sp.]